MNQRKFVRCFNCNSKPATIKCMDCNPEEPVKLCYHCDAQLHPDQDHQKQIITYDQMLENHERSVTPKPVTPIKQEQDSQHLSSILRSRIKRNIHEEIQNDEMSTSKGFKSIELKFRIKFQEQENTINLLKQHIENLETKHKENISKMREQVIKAQDEAYSKIDESHLETQKIRKAYDDKLQSYSQQLESETQFNNQLQQKLEDLRMTHQIKIQESQQQISQLRAEIERRKFQEEKIQMDADNQIIAAKKEFQVEQEKIIIQIKQDSFAQQDDLKQKLNHKQDIIIDLQNQIQQLQSTLRDVEGIWQKKLQFEAQQLEDQKLKMNELKEQYDLQIKQNKNLHSEMLIYQKENELYLKEKQNLTKQLNSIQDKNEKMDRFIYGNKKSRSKY